MPNFILRWRVNQQMAKFKIIVSDPEAGTSKVVEIEEARAVPFIGRRIGETIDGAVVDLPAHKVQIRGGSDKDGVPMRGNVHGGVRRNVVLSGGAGFSPKKKGERKRKAQHFGERHHERFLSWGRHLCRSRPLFALYALVNLLLRHRLFRQFFYR